MKFKFVLLVVSKFDNGETVHDRTNRHPLAACEPDGTADKPERSACCYVFREQKTVWL